MPDVCLHVGDVAALDDAIIEKARVGGFHRVEIMTGKGDAANGS